MGDARSVRLLLAPRPHAELAAGQVAEEMGLQVGFSRDTLGEIKLAVLEACLNALEYGGGDVEVELVAHRNADPRLEVRVVDHGPGFDPNRVPTPHLDEKLRSERKRGWGLELIRRLMDEVEISSRPGLTTVRMVRHHGRG